VAGDLVYLDSSALVKLVVPERETKALREFLRSWPERVSSVLALIEVERVARRIGRGTVDRARTVVSSVGLLGLDGGLVKAAAEIEPATLRTLDAIHLVTALSLGTDLGTLCAYDARLATAARSAGINVSDPS
jgi:predicted nucleic acid-binding protein